MSGEMDDVRYLELIKGHIRVLHESMAQAHIALVEWTGELAHGTTGGPTLGQSQTEGAGDRIDQADLDRRKLAKALKSAESALLKARNIVIGYTTVTTDKPEDRDSAKWCVNHAALGLGAEPRRVARSANGTLHSYQHCDFCYSTAHDNNGRLPDRVLLDAKSRGRITSKDIDAWAGRIKAADAAKKAKKGKKK